MTHTVPHNAGRIDSFFSFVQKALCSHRWTSTGPRVRWLAICPWVPAGGQGLLYFYILRTKTGHLRKSICSREMELSLPLQRFFFSYMSYVHFSSCPYLSLKYTIWSHTGLFAIPHTFPVLALLGIFVHAVLTAWNALLHMQIFTKVVFQ